MVAKYVLDACALTAFFCDEVGADIVESILDKAETGTVHLYMNKLNLFEVYYGVRRAEGLHRAEHIYSTVLKLPITIIDGISDAVFREAGRIKSQYKMSLADSIALGETSVMGAHILTSDHHEFDIIETSEDIKFLWTR